MALTRITSDIADKGLQYQGFKNKIIGGNFSTNPWQRGTSFASVANGTYTADRWVYNVTSDTGVVSIIRTIDAPLAANSGVFGTFYCLDVDVTTADTSITSAEYSVIEHRIEGFNTQQFGFGHAVGISRDMTLSFWHKHTKAGSYSVSFGNASSDRSYIATYTQDVAGVWEKAIITVPIDTSGTWNYSNGLGLSIRFVIACGSNFQSTAGSWQTGTFLATSAQVNGLDSSSNNFRLALVQLEYGSTASVFENRSYGQELQLCQRYTTVTNVSNYIIGQASSTTAAYFPIQFPVTMRAAPTFASTGTMSNNLVTNSAAGVLACSALTLNAVNAEKATLISTHATGTSAGQATMLLANAGNLIFTSEL